MKKIVTLAAPTFLINLFIVTGCGQMQEVLKKSQDIQEALASQCDCEDVRMINYSIKNLTTSAYYEMVGCRFESPEKEGKRIVAFLKKDIVGFCDIDQFTIDFINKGQHQIVQLEKCEDK